MGGPRLTPDDIKRAAEVFGKTGNYSEAARAIGVSESTIRTALKRERITKNRDLHARACEAGLRLGRRALVDLIALAHRIVVVENGSGTGLEPRDYAAMMNAVSKANETLATVATREDSRRAAVLNRARSRAELAALRAAGTEGGDVSVVVQVTAPVKKESGDG